MRTLLFSDTQIKLTLFSTRGGIRLRLLQHIKIRDVTRYLIKTSEYVMNKQTVVTPYNEETNKEKACKQQQQQMHVFSNRYSVSCSEKVGRSMTSSLFWNLNRYQPCCQDSSLCVCFHFFLNVKLNLMFCRLLLLHERMNLEYKTPAKELLWATCGDVSLKMHKHIQDCCKCKVCL